MLTVSETAELLRSFDRVLILTHIRPDGDTVGCAAGLCAALRALGGRRCILGMDRDDPQSTHFWRKNGFRVVRELPQDEGVIQVAERLLTE